MSVKITDNTDKIRLETTVKINVWLRFMCDEIVKAAEQFTPKKAGNLRRDITKAVSGLSATIKWGKDYAFYQEFNQYAHYTTPGTGPGFVEKGVAAAATKIPAVAHKAGLI